MVQAKGQAERYAKALPADHGWPPVPARRRHRLGADARKPYGFAPRPSRWLPRGHGLQDESNCRSRSALRTGAIACDPLPNGRASVRNRLSATAMHIASNPKPNPDPNPKPNPNPHRLGVLARPSVTDDVALALDAPCFRPMRLPTRCRSGSDSGCLPRAGMRTGARLTHRISGETTRFAHAGRWSDVDHHHAPATAPSPSVSSGCTRHPLL